MARQIVLPQSYTAASVITVDDYGSGPNVNMTISEVISHLKAINPEFNAFVLITNFGRFIGPMLAWKLLPGTPYIGCNPYLTSGYYSVGIKRDLLNNISGNNCYCLINGTFQSAPDYGMVPTIENKDGVSYATYNRPSDWATPILAVEADALYINNVYTTFYSWTAWDQISGNSGQYRCNLTKIKDGSITVDTTTTDGTESDFDRLSSQSSIWAIFQNMSVGTEKIVAWSGENWMTLTLVDHGIPDTYSFVFKFYAPAISATAPFYTISRTITYGGSVPTRDLWLSFVYDEEQQAAVFLPVSYDTGGLQPGYEWGGVSATSDEMLYLYMWLQASGAGTPEYPYDTGTTDNGGNPGGPQPGDHMPTPGVPTLSGMSSGMFTVYNPTNTQLEQIAAFLWSDNVIDNIKKYFNNFADNIIALYVLPCKLSNLPTKSFKVGNMQSDTITGVEYLTQRFTAVDMGSVYIKNVFDSYLDYSPFTKFEIYLPGIGLQTLSADDIAAPTDPETGTLKAVEGSIISLTYNVDLMTGLVVAMVKINGELKYQFPGKVGYSIPLTGANYTQMVTGFITAAAGLVGAAATGGLSAPLSAAGVGAAVSGTVNAMKPEIHRGGNLSGDVSSISERTPYIICHRPNKPLLENQERYTGFPSYKSGTLSEFSGLTQVIDAHIEGISCTEAERAEILNLLKSGVIL